MKISIALCSYNGEIYLSEQLDCIISQTLKPNEIVICDDGSADKTIDIIEQYIKNYPSLIKLYQNKLNIGVIKNFEQAISCTSGDIVFLADQDDIWISTKIEETISYMQNHPRINVVFTNGEIINQNGHKECYTIFDCVGLNKSLLKNWDKNALDILAWGNRVTGATIALRKSYFDQNLFPFINDYYLHDYQIAIKAANQRCLGYIDRSLIKYRLHENQCLGLSLEYADSMGIFNSLYPRETTDLFQEILSSNIEHFKLSNRRAGWIKNNLLIRIRVVLWHIADYIKTYKQHAPRYIISDIITCSK